MNALNKALLASITEAGGGGGGVSVVDIQEISGDPWSLTGVQSGDLILQFCHKGGTAGPTTPNSFTLLDSNVNAHWSGVYYGSGLSSGSPAIVDGVVIALRNCALTAPPYSAATDSSASADPPAVNSFEVGLDMVVCFASIDTGNITDGPSSYTTTINSDGRGAGAYKLAASATEDPSAFTNTDEQWNAWTIRVAAL